MSSPTAHLPARPPFSWTGSLARALFVPVDIGFLVFFRGYFGALMLWTAWEFYSHRLIASLYINPPFHFTYDGFSWLRPWPGAGMYAHFAVLDIFSVGVMAGFLYRLSAFLLWLGFTYVFLLEKAVYLNHYYLMCLLSFLLIFLPAHRAGSVDVLLRPSLRATVVPAWTLWLLRFQVAIPYVYGGLAKLKGDWLQGQPMQMWLSISAWRVLLGPVVEEQWVALLFSWGGLLFDLSIVPLLLWRRTRAPAFGAAVVFHLLNAFMFDIGIFPWMMIGATTVFFAPDWPRRLLTPPHSQPAPLPAPPRPSARRRRLTVGLLLVYVVLQLVLPFRHWLYGGNVLWTEEGALFAWNMMLRAKVNALRFLVTDPATGRVGPADITRWLSPQQVESMGHDPEMIRQFAHYLRQQYLDKGQDIEVHVVALCSLNGRKPQLLLDPRVDLAREPRRWSHAPYLVPLREPFRWPPWNVPVKEWEAHLAGPQRPVEAPP